MIVGVEFDEVGAGGDLVAHCADDLVDAADFLRTLREATPGSKPLGP